MSFSLIIEVDKNFFNRRREKSELHEIPVPQNDLLNYSFPVTFSCLKPIMETPKECAKYDES